MVRKMLLAEKSKLCITVTSIAVTVMLMLFLGGIYEGVKIGAIGYVAHSAADIWICQDNSRNLLRSSSFLRTSTMDNIEKVSGVLSVEGILRVIATARMKEREATMFVFGIPAGASMSAPKIFRGDGTPDPGEIIIDRSFAEKNVLTVGDSLNIQGIGFRVSGVCTETNATVAQYSFVNLSDAQKLLGFPGIVSFLLVRTDGRSPAGSVIGKIRAEFPSLSVFDRETFLANNLTEMENGVLPILGTILILGLLSGVLVITLMFYQSILEMRDDYALMKAIGARSRFLSSLVLRQTLLVTSTGFIAGLVFSLAGAPFLEKLVPELNVVILPGNIIFVLALSLLVGSVGSALPLRKLRDIYPAEVFRV